VFVFVFVSGGQFLVGTHPRDEAMYSLISQHKELAEHGALSRGPLDLQHANFIKALRSSGAVRSAKQSRLVAEALKEARGAAAAGPGGGGAAEAAAQRAVDGDSPDLT